MSTDAPIRHISDTALWAAMFRAMETDRPDALFRDPFARKLAGERGEQILRSMPDGVRHEWTWVTRTHLFDNFIISAVREGADMVVNLAAGLDARPYRMNLPITTKWVEVDLPDILAHKEKILAGERTRFSLERIPLDLNDVPARRELFARLGASAKKVVVVTEGLLIYLAPEDVAGLASDLAEPPSFKWWVLDLCSPGLLKILQKQLGAHLEEARAPFRFGPREGPLYFLPYGWRPRDVRGIMKSASKLKRLSFFLNLISKLPESLGKQGGRPWGGICLMEKA